VIISCQKIYPLNGPAEVARRLLLWLPEFSGVADLELRIEHAVRVLGDCKNMTKIAWMKTVFDGWPTAYRKHEAVRPCLFGCSVSSFKCLPCFDRFCSGCRLEMQDCNCVQVWSDFVSDTDRLKHYVNCPVLWATIRVLKCRRDNGTPLSHMCLHNPTIETCSDLHLALEVYQAIACLPNVVPYPKLLEHFRDAIRRQEQYSSTNVAPSRSHSAPRCSVPSPTGPPAPTLPAHVRSPPSFGGLN
jgi:hypothetical protein